MNSHRIVWAINAKNSVCELEIKKKKLGHELTPISLSYQFEKQRLWVKKFAYDRSWKKISKKMSFVPRFDLVAVKN